MVLETLISSPQLPNTAASPREYFIDFVSWLVSYAVTHSVVYESKLFFTCTVFNSTASQNLVTETLDRCAEKLTVNPTHEP
jgi:hypothetical protein